MSITLRLDKGTELTWQELDDNFKSVFYSSSLNGDILYLYATGSIGTGSMSQSIDLSYYNPNDKYFYSASLSGSNLVFNVSGSGNLTKFVDILPVANSVTGSLYYTASFSNNTLTITRKDGTSDNIDLSSVNTDLVSITKAALIASSSANQLTPGRIYKIDNPNGLSGSIFLTAYDSSSVSEDCIWQHPIGGGTNYATAQYRVDQDYIYQIYDPTYGNEWKWRRDSAGTYSGSVLPSVQNYINNSSILMSEFDNCTFIGTVRITSSYSDFKNSTINGSTINASYTNFNQLNLSNTTGSIFFANSNIENSSFSVCDFNLISACSIQVSTFSLNQFSQFTFSNFKNCYVSSINSGVTSYSEFLDSTITNLLSATITRLSVKYSTVTDCTLFAQSCNIIDTTINTVNSVQISNFDLNLVSILKAFIASDGEYKKYNFKGSTQFYLNASASLSSSLISYNVPDRFIPKNAVLYFSGSGYSHTGSVEIGIEGTSTSGSLISKTDGDLLTSNIITSTLLTPTYINISSSTATSYPKLTATFYASGSQLYFNNVPATLVFEGIIAST